MSDRSRFHDAMADACRRRILYALCDVGEREQLSVHPRSDLIPAPDSPEVKARLAHVHLPKLEQYYYVDWQRGSFVIARGPNFDRVEPLLEALRDLGEDVPE